MLYFIYLVYLYKFCRLFKTAFLTNCNIMNNKTSNLNIDNKIIFLYQYYKNKNFNHFESIEIILKQFPTVNQSYLENLIKKNNGNK